MQWQVYNYIQSLGQKQITNKWHKFTYTDDWSVISKNIYK